MSNTDIVVPRSRRKMPGMLTVVLVILALLASFVMVVMVTLDARLKTEEAQLDGNDPGWRLDDIEAKRATVPDEENSAKVIVAVASLLPTDWPKGEIFDSLAEAPANRRLSAGEYGGISNELSEVSAAVPRAHLLADMPRGRHNIVYVRPNLINTLLVDQQSTRQVASLLRLNARIVAEDGDLQAALRDCRGIVNCGRSIGDEPLLISMLIRTASVTLGCNTARDVLAQGEPPVAEISALQKLLEDEDAFPDQLTGMRGERACVHELVGGIVSGAVRLSAFGRTPAGSAEDWLVGLFHSGFKMEHVSILSTMTRYVECALLPMDQQAEVENRLDTEFRKVRFAPLARLIIPAIGHVAESSRRKHAHMRSLIVCLAAERYRRTHHEWPKSIDALVPTEISAVPTDPYDGKPIRYKVATDGIIAYSVGADRSDDNGNLAQGGNFLKKGFDIGFRLWNPDQRRQKPKE